MTYSNAQRTAWSAAALGSSRQLACVRADIAGASLCSPPPRSSSPWQAPLRSAPCAISFFGERRIASALGERPYLVARRAAHRVPDRRVRPVVQRPPEAHVMNADGSGQRNLTPEWRLDGVTMPFLAGISRLVSGLAEGRVRAGARRPRLRGHLRHERRRERAPPPDAKPAEGNQSPGGAGRCMPAGVRRRSRLVARRAQAGVRPYPGWPRRHLRRQCGWKRAAQAGSRDRVPADGAAPRARASAPIRRGRRTGRRSRS